MPKLTDDGKTYNQCDAAFRDIWAGVVMKGAERVATISIKIGGRSSPNGLTVTAYVHVIGLPMQKGIARGYGYDMKTAAIAAAARKIPAIPEGNILRVQRPEVCEAADAFKALQDAGHDVPHQLRAMGFEFWQAV